ncbi:related to Rpb4-16 kD subunit of DNA-directed RNA polymerase II [Ustilago bromivora]|uniref:Related to Rpb4 - 16 kD subunit of DNA-directed RNA polymerase II n=1 Tax=Ustilago bromivora TaxID=307758 RepID=A0A1K0GAN0_9BASI|nr:related to Rpb4-16 kD subunit of DNA-directed RNA polymerase II [Ustilago bromivora]SPC66364.1 related to Rpb4 - 16 kD subunit of DNA-directed RNA polymerase II [Ustilago sp. UG-2017b]SYW80188.1 related to Rpb4 - 16 kD subunit of DNA-directed RNA polymerase II [Ustilago bromivora]
MQHEVGRRHRGMIEDEDAAIGKLGAEFDDAGCLLISEVELVFSQPGALNSSTTSTADGSRDEVATAVFSKTKDYVSEFSRYKDPNTIREIRELLLKHARLDERQVDEEGNEIEETGLQLTQFEMAQLANLCITEVEEAKALIPTLATRDEAMLDGVLQEMDNVRRFS